MREPGIQTKLLASPPIFFGAWGLAAWSVWQCTLESHAWPIALCAGLGVAAVMKADEQVRAWERWQAEWDAMGGQTVPPPRMGLRSVLALVLSLPLLSLLIFAGQHGGSQALIGVLLLLCAPIVAMAALVRLGRWVRQGRVKRAARVEPVKLAIRRPIFPVPSLSGAYRGLPAHCRALIGSMP